MAWYHWLNPATWFRSRLALPESSRGYEGAGRGRRFTDWTTSGRSANAEIGRAASLLRERSRDLVRNNAYAAAAVRALVANIVGDGIRPRAATSSAAVNKALDAYWKRWAPKAMVGPPIGMAGLQALAVRSWLESGEVLVRRRWRRPEVGLPVPVQLQMLEADHLDSGRNEETPNGGRIVMGVEIGPIDELRAYHLFRTHPGETMSSLQSSLRTTSRVPAEDIAHLYMVERPGQLRGIPVLAPAIRRFRNLDDYEDAELVRKKVEACFVGIVSSDEEEEEGIAGKVTDANGDVVEVLEPGLIGYSRGGKTITFNQPHSVGGYAEYKRSELQSIAAAVGLTYELLSGDLSKVNYSSIRAGLIEFRRNVRGMRACAVLPLLLTPTWRWFVEAAVLAGVVAPPPEGVDILDVYPCKWPEPRFEEVDRKKEAEADLAELKAGTISLPTLLARKGFEWLEVLGEHAEVKQVAEKAGIKLDSLPFYGAKPGGAEEPDDEEPDDEDPDDEDDEDDEDE